MAKIVILGDLHLGARNASTHFSDYFNSFFTDTLFPFCQVHGVKNIIQLGDLFDSRTSISLKAFHRSKDVWFGSLAKHGIHMHTLLGNHDIHYKESLVINSPELFLGEFSDSVTIVNKPSQINLDGYDIDLVPWICSENLEEVSAFIERPERPDIVCGHFEFSGFKMQANSPLTSELDSAAKLFSSRYKKVLSGHFHTRSEVGNILYTGIPYEITWADYADPKGFHVLDTDTGELTFVRNNDTMFRTVTFRGEQPTASELLLLSGKMVKGFYDSSTASDREIEIFSAKLRSAGTNHLTFHDTAQTVQSSVSVDGVDVSLLDIRVAIKNYVDDFLKNDKDKIEPVMAIMNELHTMALAIDPTSE